MNAQNVAGAESVTMGSPVPVAELQRLKERPADLMKMAGIQGHDDHDIQLVVTERLAFDRSDGGHCHILCICSQDSCDCYGICDW